MNNRKRKNSSSSTSTWSWGSDLEPSQALQDEYREKHKKYLQWVEDYRNAHDGAEPPAPEQLSLATEDFGDGMAWLVNPASMETKAQTEDVKLQASTTLTQEVLPAIFMQDLFPREQENNNEMLIEPPPLQYTNDETERVYREWNNTELMTMYNRQNRPIVVEQPVTQETHEGKNNNEVIDNVLELNEAYIVTSPNWAGRPR